MLRRVDYRAAVNMFVFTGLWLVIGAVALWSPVPGVLGVAGGMFVSYILLFFLLLGIAGITLTVAAFNGVFPPSVRAPQQPARAARPLPAMWSQGSPQHAAGSPNGGDAQRQQRTARGQRPRGS